MGNPKPVSIPFLSIFLVFQALIMPSTSTITTSSKDQIACSMCSACDNPCQPVPSLPPPSPPLPSPPPPDCAPPPPSPPPPASDSNCPPPPLPPSTGTYYYSPPPPSLPSYTYASPPPPDGSTGGAFYPPPTYGNFPWPPPPNPITPYFPFNYYYNPPASSNYFSTSNYLKTHPIVSSLLISLSFLFLF